jgi:hypothetical protein
MTILRFVFATTLLFNAPRVAALQFANPFAALIKKSPVKVESPIPAQVRSRASLFREHEVGT